MMRRNSLKRRPHDGGGGHNHSHGPRDSFHHSPDGEPYDDGQTLLGERDQQSTTCFSFTGRCGVKSALGKKIADIACLCLILLMLAGVAFSCYSVATVYMQLGERKAAAALSSSHHRGGHHQQRRNVVRLDDDNDDGDGDDVLDDDAYRHPATRRSSDGRRQLVPPDPQIALPASAAKLHVFRQAAVSSDSEVCSEIGKNFLLPRHGGNAVDAALATLFCNGLVTMQSMGLGGGFVANVFIASERRAYALNARERAPAAAAAAASEAAAGGAKPPSYGPAAIAVPGEALGYWALHERFATVDWEKLWAPTVALCRRGFVQTRHMADFVRPEFREDEHLSKMFVDPATNEFYPAGHLIKPPPALCDLYHLLATRGAPDFYNGTIANLLLRDLHDLGTTITADDLQAFRVQWSDTHPVPLDSSAVLHITPAPSSGPLVGQMMRVLHGIEWRDADSEAGGDVMALHRLAEVFKWAFAQRMRLGDPDFVAGVDEFAEKMTSTKMTDYIRGRFSGTRTFAHPRDYGATELDEEMSEHGTAHVSVMGPNGDAVSVTSSINYYFGCGRTGHRTGLLFNTGLDDFAHAGHRNHFSLPASAANRIDAGKRAMSSMAPLIVTDPHTGIATLVIGATGGTKIPTALVQVLLRVLCWRQSLKQAVDSPRLHHQLVPMRLDYEYGVTEQLVAELRRLGHRVRRYGERGSIVTALMRNASGVFGVADYRKRGEVVGL